MLIGVKSMSNFFGENKKEIEKCDCEWCSVVSPTYQRLIKLINDNVGMTNTDEILRIVKNLNVHHLMVYQECEIFKEEIQNVIKPGRN